MAELKRTGRPRAAAGTRVRDFRTVAVQLPPAYEEKLEKIAEITGTRAGRWTTDRVLELLDLIDLEALAAANPHQTAAVQHTSRGALRVAS